MNFKAIPKSVPVRVIIEAAFYLIACIGVLLWRMHDYIQLGCSWRRIAFYIAAMVVCVVADWFFLSGEKIACAFMLGVSVYGTIFCMALMLDGYTLLLSILELALLAFGAYTFFTGKYFVGDGVYTASTVDSMFIVLGSGICLIPVFSFLVNGGLPVEAIISFVCAVLYCMHTKAGKYCVTVYILSALFVYAVTFYYTRIIFHLLIAIAYVILIVITYKQKENLNLRLKSHK